MSRIAKADINPALTLAAKTIVEAACANNCATPSALGVIAQR